MVSLRTSLTNRSCGPKPGLAGIYLLFFLVSYEHPSELALQLHVASNVDVINVQSVCKFLFLDGDCRFLSFGGPIPHRPIEDLTYAVASFIQKGGSLVSYYMVSNLNVYK